VDGIADAGGDQREFLLQGVGGAPDDAAVVAGAEVDGPGDVGGDLEAVAADLGDDPGGDRPGAVADFAVADHEPGEQDRLGSRLVSAAFPGCGLAGLLGGPVPARDVDITTER
jgi:hypothetical protein